MNRQSGFTLVELMVTIAIAAILLGLGVPSFRTLIENNRIAAASNDIVTALQFARSEAVKRAVLVDFCGTADQVTCVAAGATGSLVRTAAGDVLRLWPAPGNGVAIVAPNVQFNALGAAVAARCFRITLGALERSVNVSASGTVTTVKVPPGPACP
jgi:type IV fimbrial biogenesis protein FimT